MKNFTKLNDVVPETPIEDDFGLRYPAAGPVNILSNLLKQDEEILYLHMKNKSISASNEQVYEQGKLLQKRSRLSSADDMGTEMTSHKQQRTELSSSVSQMTTVEEEEPACEEEFNQEELKEEVYEDEEEVQIGHQQIIEEPRMVGPLTVMERYHKVKRFLQKKKQMTAGRKFVYEAR